VQSERYPELAAALATYISNSEFKTPSNTQLESTELFNRGHYFLQAPTGAGKTIAALIPVLHKLLNAPGQRAMIIAPTRELGIQIKDICAPILDALKLSHYALIGGEDYKVQERNLAKKPQLLIATPGRLVTHLETQKDAISDIELAIFDEADQLLNPERIVQLIGLLKHVDDLQESTFLSATIGHRTIDVCEQHFGIRPKLIKTSAVDRPETSAYILPCDHRDHKIKTLMKLLEQEGAVPKSILFCHRQDFAKSLEGKLKYHGINAIALHGGLTPKGRKRVIEIFKSDPTAILCTTELSARGLDFSDINCVINLDIPRDFDQYTHRVGRAGRRGQESKIYNFVNPDEWNRVVGFCRRLNCSVEKLLTPGAEGAYTGPKKLKASGKAAGKKKKVAKGKAGTKKAGKKPGKKKR